MIGLGWAGSAIWLPRLRRHPAFDLVAAVDPAPRPEAAAAAASAGVPVLATVEELNRERVDFAVVAVPNHLHSEVATRLLRRDVSVFVEKPVCLSAAEADRLTEAESNGQGVLVAGSAARCRADVRRLYELAGTVGPIRHIDLAWVRARGVPDGGGWFTQRRLAGGGALMDLGWHLLDIVGPILGEVEFEQAVATTSDDFVHASDAAAAWRHHEDAPPSADAAPIDVEDTVRSFLVTPAGTAVSLRASWASHEPCDVTSIRVEGSAGTVHLRCTFGFSPNRLPSPVLTLLRDGEVVVAEVPPEPVGAEYDRQLDELPALLAEPATRGRSVTEAHRTIALISRLYESARTRRTATPARRG
uniref:Oxidoreductase n=1 Tax=Verrucosispora sp. TaxID=1871626 RepID=A0A894JPD1_9ACTN|nr:oxidoreductase [Verrucosispora sp.]